MNFHFEHFVYHIIYLTKDFPHIVHYKTLAQDSTNLVSIYSNNDKALDLLNNANDYLNTNLYSEALTAFDAATLIPSKERFDVPE